MLKQAYLLPILLLTVGTFSARAQRFSYSTTPVVDVTGKPVPVSNFMHIKGSPYLIDEWVPGEVVTDKDQLHKGMLLKYNLQTDMLTFVYNAKEEPLRFAEPIRAFTIYAEQKMSFANNFPKIDGYGKDSYYEVIALGKTMLLKHYRQLIKETRADDRSLTDGIYVQRANYYILKDNKMNRAKLNKDVIMKVLADRESQLNNFLTTTPIDFSKEDEVKKVFDYYNSL